MLVQIVNFNLTEMTDEEFLQMADEVAPAFAAVPGLLSKVWLRDVASNTYGGVYSWRDEASQSAYAASDLCQAVITNPHFANLTSRTFGVIDAPTSVTRGSITAAISR